MLKTCRFQPLNTVLVIVLLVLLSVCYGSVEVHSTADGEDASHNGLLESHGNDIDNETGRHGDNETHAHPSHEAHGVHVVSWKFDYVKQPWILTVFMILVVLVKLGFHSIHILSNYVPESCVLILLGTLVGGVLHASKVDTSDFYYIHPDKFFLFLLPPCILEASYELHDSVFFKNLGTILLYAVIGTLLNCFIIGPILYGLAVAGMMGSAFTITLIECLVFASLVVAVDPVAVLAIFQEIGVNNVLYFLVFGESLLNDAVTVVLYNTMTALSEMDEIPASEIAKAFAAFFTVSLGGLTIGLIFGIVTSFVTKYTQHIRVVEPLEVLAMAYCSYLTAELFHFSGIISMIGCGIIQVHYAFHNICQNSQTTIKYFIKMLSTTCDCIIFMFLGIALVRDDHEWNTGFVIGTVVLCLAVRFLVTICLTLFANNVYRERRVNIHEQFIMGYGGLRGAVAFCLVAMLNEDTIPHKKLFQTAVFVVILFTVFVQGISIKPLVYLLKIGLSEEKVVSLYQEINSHVTVHTLAGVEDIIGHFGSSHFKAWLLGIDFKFKEKLQRDPLTNDEKIMELYKEIAVQQHYEMIYGPCDEDYGSQMLLYQPHKNERGEENGTEDEHKPLVHASSITVPFEQEIFHRLDSIHPLVQGSRKSLPATEWKSRQTPPTPDIFSPSGKRVKRFFSEDHTGQTAGEPGVEPVQMRRRHLTDRATSALRKSISGPADEEPGDNVTPKYLHKLLLKTSATNAFLRHTDRNLRKDENSDFLYHLQEKQRRHERFMRSGSIYSPTADGNVSSRGSLDNLHARDKSFMGDTAAEEAEMDPSRKRSSVSQLDKKPTEPGPGYNVQKTWHASDAVRMARYVPKFKPRRNVARLSTAQVQYLRPKRDGTTPTTEYSTVAETPAGASATSVTGIKVTPLEEKDEQNADERVVLLASGENSEPPIQSRSHSEKARGHLKRQDGLAKEAKDSRDSKEESKL